MPGFTRDPLSPAFDPLAAELISRAIGRYHRYYQPRHAAPSRRTVRQESKTWQKGSFRNEWWDLNINGAQRLTRRERAFERALYYDPRIVSMNPRWHPDAEWSLKVDWGPRSPVPGASRRFRLRVFTPGSAARYARALPASQSYGKNDQLLAVNQDLPR